jgi:dGTPase
MDWRRLLSPERLRPTTRTTNGDRRNEFESDYGRIVFSPAIRRMHDKTQVFPLTTDDNIHTRLTHSLEVASVAQSMGVNVCLDKRFMKKLGKVKEDPIRIIPVILASTALCHDIGNPPFGHYGEEVIRNFFLGYFKKNNVRMSEPEKKDFLKFNGNAQGFRVLTKGQVLQDTYGLNLTVGTLSSFLKYPLMGDELVHDKDELGVFQSERESLRKIRELTSLGLRRHPLSFLMEAADDICYLIMDIEDGFKKGYYGARDVLDFMLSKGNDNVRKSAKQWDKEIIKKVKPINKETTEMVKLRIKLFTQFVDMACREFLVKISEIEDGNYEYGLIMNEEDGLGKTLKNFCKEQIYDKHEIHSLELTGKSVLDGLLKHFVDGLIETDNNGGRQRAKRLLSMVGNSVKIITELETGKKLDGCSVYFKLRGAVDHISGMTDSFALNLYRKLEGMRLG